MLSTMPLAHCKVHAGLSAAHHVEEKNTRNLAFGSSAGYPNMCCPNFSVKNRVRQAGASEALAMVLPQVDVRIQGTR